MLERTQSTTQLTVQGEPFLILGGEIHNSSSSSAAYMEPLWPRLRGLGLNTVLIPITWELCEPKEGAFDFALLGVCLEKARAHGLHLVLLWFGTWKNASSSYVPGWVKRDRARYFRALGPDGMVTDAISCFCDACCEKDARAFAEMMAYLRDADQQHTVLAVQVENEVGVLGTARDYRTEANAAFEAPLPIDFARYLDENRAQLAPGLLDDIRFDRLHKSWAEAFSGLAEEVFMAYHTARYVQRIAEAGKAELPLPLFVNAWTDQCDGEPGGMHPSGGPTAQMHAVWRCAAPAIDVLAPDLYLENFAAECAAYTRLPHNPLMIPEARADRWMQAHAFYAIGEHDAICFSPFGVDDLGVRAPTVPGMPLQDIFATIENVDTSDLIRQTYGTLSSIAPIICANRGTGKMHGILQSRLMHDVVRLKNYDAKINYARYLDNAEVPAGGLIIELGGDEILVAGAGFSVQFFPKTGNPAKVDYISHEEGCYKDQQWMCIRRLNGDELHLPMTNASLLRKIELVRIDIGE